MTTQQKIDKIAGDIRVLYRTDNDAPRLLAEMMWREFPYPRRVWNDNPDARRGVKGGWGMKATERGRY